MENARSAQTTCYHVYRKLLTATLAMVKSTDDMGLTMPGSPTLPRNKFPTAASLLVR